MCSRFNDEDLGKFSQYCCTTTYVPLSYLSIFSAKHFWKGLTFLVTNYFQVVPK